MRTTYITLGLFGLAAIVGPLAFSKPEKQSVHLAQNSVTERGSPIKTIKPGAAVTFSHSFADDLKRNSQNTTDLKISHNYFSGQLRVMLNPPEGIAIGQTDLERVFDLSGPGEIDLPINFSALADGFHVVGVYAEWTDGFNRKTGRAYSIPVQIGDDVVVSQKPLSNSGFVELPAEMTIE